jgi:HK97 family phage major capsid protein
MRQLASVMNVNTTAMTFALDDEDMVLQARGEVDAVTQTDTPEFGEVRIDVHEISAKPKATLQVLEDSTLNLEAWLSGKVASRIARQQNAAFINGDGIKKARGILDYADTGVNTYKRNALGTAETAGSLVLAGDDLIDLQSNLLEDYQPGATWLMHRLIWAKIVKLKDNEGRYLLDPLMLFNGATPQLLGAPVRMAGDMPAPTAGALVAGTNYVCYGDFSEGYTILDRLGINVIMDNVTQSGFVNWYFRTRYGGGVTNFQAIKRLKAKA